MVAMQGKIRVLIADDHAVLRDGLRAFLNATEGIEVVGEAEDGMDAVEKAVSLQPDVVLMDIAMPRSASKGAELRPAQGPAKVLVLTQYDNKGTSSRCSRLEWRLYLKRRGLTISAIRRAPGSHSCPSAASRHRPVSEGRRDQRHDSGSISSATARKKSSSSSRRAAATAR
jgi:DNA-binding NarL/FixJ family response regulator